MFFFEIKGGWPLSMEIGQIRYTGSGCVSNMGFTVSSKKVAIGTDSASSATSFYDIEIKPTSGTFVKDADYYLKIAIPQDMNYELSFNLKLTKVENNSTTVYQFLKNITVERGGTGNNIYKVVLYEKSTGEIDVMIPLPYQGSGTPNEKDLVYYDTVNDKYYLGLGSSGSGINLIYEYDNNFIKYNEISAAASWKSEAGTRYGVFELTFRPVEDDFSAILLEMVRTAEDYSIQHIDESSGIMYFGRVVDPVKVASATTLYSINNLIPKMNPAGESVSRIGVWGHPGLQMTVNGEPIAIGPSGHYEIDVLPIKSLGIVAPDNDFKNNWTVDFAYDNSVLIETE